MGLQLARGSGLENTQHQTQTRLDWDKGPAGKRRVRRQVESPMAFASREGRLEKRPGFVT